jgi:aryl-alcohol dehydrogenase-like predicted oxidoreductase
MEMRKLGRSGLGVSLIGLGCNNFGERVEFETARQIVHKALDLGVAFFDTADRYGGIGGSEKALGEIFGPKRKEIVLATKFGIDPANRRQISGASRRYIMSAVEASLTRLKTDWIDLYQIHRPDPGTPIEETVRAFDDLIKDGKVRYWGVSNFAGWQTTEAHWTAKHLGLNLPISVQDEYSLAYRGHEQELIPAMVAGGMGLLPYRPLASGILTGKYKRNAPLPEGSRLAKMKHHADKYAQDANFDVAEKLGVFAEARGHKLTELAFAWLAAKPFVSSIIPGATSPAQVEENVAAASKWRLTADDLAEIDKILAG